MIRKIMKNAIIIAAATAMLLGFGTDTKAADAYRDTAVAGIDAAIDQYVTTQAVTAETTEEAEVSTEASTVEPVQESTDIRSLRISLWRMSVII